MTVNLQKKFSFEHNVNSEESDVKNFAQIKTNKLDNN